MKRASIATLLAVTLLSCVAANPPSSSDSAQSLRLLPNQEDAYVQLRRTLYLAGNGFALPLGEYSAGGVCVELTDDGCYVLTVNHFCAPPSEMTDEALASLPGKTHFMDVATTFEGASGFVDIIDTHPPADLCLMHVTGDMSASVQSIQDLDAASLFDPLVNYGAPRGMFNPRPRPMLFAYTGRWAGFCTERCAIPAMDIDYDNFIVYSIPTTRGQSGSPIFMSRNLFSIQVASNLSVDDYGIGASPEAIRDFLGNNGIILPVLP